MSLVEVKKGQRVRIKSLNHTSELQALLMGLGLLPGDEVEVIGQSIFGSPVTIQRGDDTVAMRTHQAKLIQVEAI